LLLHASRPDIVGRHLLALMKTSGCVAGAELMVRGTSGEMIERFGDFSTEEASQLSITLGTAGNDIFGILIQPRIDSESRATLAALLGVMNAARELERSREGEEEQLTVWPLDEDLPDETTERDSVIIGKMNQLMASARRVAKTNVCVLISGESGTGKELLARAIHRFSVRRHRPFVPVNCTAIPRELLESQLFGHRRGAFTGAERDHEGMVRAAREGTLFLDEIGELDLNVQPKLLRFLESGEIAPLGTAAPLHVDVRIVAATNADLEQLVREGRFREDLFYRLNVIRLSIPPLRERRDEIPALVRHLVSRCAIEFGKGRMRMSEDAMELLLLYDWPGNVRQLQNEIRRMLALADPDTVLPPKALSPEILQQTAKSETSENISFAVVSDERLSERLARVEREMIKSALKTHGGVEAAATALGISRKGLYLKRRRLGV
jgi:transcriptional regulator with PAS, ATPase and Fis domain